MAKQQTLAFTIQGGGVSNINPWIAFGHQVTAPAIRLKTTTADLPGEFYWVLILDAFNPGIVLQEFVIPAAAGNPTLPSNLDAAMSDPAGIYVVATKQLSLQNVPTGAWYDLLIKYGAGSELQRLNQLSTTLQPGVFNGAGYVLTGQGGPRGGNNIPPPAYELATITNPATILAMSWIPTASGKPPYSLIDEFTVNVRVTPPKTKGNASGLKSKAKGSKKAGSRSKR